MSGPHDKREIFEVKNRYEVSKHYLENHYLDPFGPIKLDHPEWLHRITVIEAELLQRISQIEHHLEVDAPAGRAFIRSHQRPDEGSALQQISENLGKLSDRVQALEGKLDKTSEPARR